MKLHLENIKTKVGDLVDQSIELSDANCNITAIFESPNTMATVVDIDDDAKDTQGPEPFYNTLIVSDSNPFVVFSVHYDHRYITRKFKNYR